MTIALTEDARLTLPRELVIGRVVMIAFLSVLLLREFASFGGSSAAERTWISVLLVALAAGWIWFWWRLAAGSATVAIAVALTLVVVPATAIVALNPIGVFPFYYAVIVAGAAYPWRTGVPLVTLTCGLTFVTWTLVADGARGWEVLLITALFGGAAITVRRFVASQIALNQSQEAIRLLATSEARADLARDLHDQLGQELTVGVLQAEMLVSDLSESSPAVRDRAALVLSATRQALLLMRETVSDARAPRVGDELSAAKTLLAAAGVTCDVSVECSIDSVRAETVLGWIVREGVTNVLRHSGAHHCHIDLTRIGDAFVLTIRDDGDGTTSTGPGSGLAIMEHRLTTVGGALSAERTDGGGFRLVATVPVVA